MGRISGWLWIVGAAVGVVGTFLPGAIHRSTAAVLALAAVVLLYGAGSVTGVIPWHRASIRTLAIGMVLTIPVVGLAIYLTGGVNSYVTPLLFCSLLYAALFFPARWAWPLSAELVLVAGAPLLYEPGAASDLAFPSRYLAIAVTFFVLTGVMVSLKSRLVDAEARQREIANIDPLTGVANRRAFDSALRGELARRVDSGGRRSGDQEPFGLLIIDLDDFKAINDEYGHPVGDAVLRRAAERAGSVLRSTDRLARIGGDEFAVIAPGARGENAQALAEAVVNSVSANDPGQRAPVPRASAGIAVFPEDGQSFEALMRAADQRLLRLKADGRHLASRGEDGGTLRLL